MNRIRIGAGLTGLLALLLAFLVSPAAAGSRPAAAPHHAKLTVTVVPRHPVPGEQVRIYVTGTLRGGRYYDITGGCIGDRCWQGAPSCAPSHRVEMYREPVNVFTEQRFKHEGRYPVSLVLSAACVRPELPERHVRTTVGVQPEHRTTLDPEQPMHGKRTTVIVRSHARGGRFLMATSIRYGDGSGHAIAVDCIPNPPKRELHRDPYTVRTSHVWKRPKTYTMRITMTAPCTRPRVKPQHLVVTVPVR